jgi:triosephosphate isomerase
MTKRLIGNLKSRLDYCEAQDYESALIDSLVEVAPDFDNIEVTVLAPYTDLRTIQLSTRKSPVPIKYGSQDVSGLGEGEHTGEVSARMLKKLGCSYSLINHLERRKYFDETVDDMRRKAECVLKNEYTPIICITDGDTHHLKAIAQILIDERFEGQKILIAYEPSSAVGDGGEPMTPEAASTNLGNFKKQLCDYMNAELSTSDYDEDDLKRRTCWLYGGSVNSKNSGKYIQLHHIDGLLIGRAALSPDHFAHIVHEVNDLVGNKKLEF